MTNHAAAVEPLHLAPTDLPPRPAKSIQTLIQEREQDAWYWRALGITAAFFIMIGFLIFPGAFNVDTNDPNDQQTISITVGALVIINVGFILSVALWFLRKNWLYQLDCIFSPCLISSVFGFINTLIAPNMILKIHVFTAPALASLIVSVISSVIYGLLCLFTWKRLEKLRKSSSRDAHRVQNTAWTSDEELQRTQWNNLYQRQGENITASQFNAHRTYHIDPLPLSRKTSFHGDASNGGYGGGYHTM